ncbi:MAG: HAD family phosphatase [Reyranella sp.]|uniref:HAD family hydrolase n=1 Tax=Reyranella sp. TaxID=1929291 RepID=UPI001AC46C34|nr:HAD family phosphatase [Reyranella sp.]MBN9087528.1 HAD family phosphatase [Reyranella sp.]
MSLPRRVAAVVFDMDGVLFDTETLYEKSALGAAREVGIPMTSEFFRSTVGSPSPVVRAQVVAHYGPDVPVDKLWEISRRIFGELTETQEILKPGVRELLDLLDELGLPRAVATSSVRPTVERHLHKHGLADRFHGIAAQGDYEHHKPHPDPFLKAAELLGVAPQDCLAVEDSHHGVRSASSAGMMTVMVPDLLPATDEICALCLHVMPDLHEVRRLLIGSASAFPAGG